ncbi:MAG: hypothetical protein IT497_10050 [Ottowia sp.]|nr:hypothetical protein [Ottowia sp.]
MTPQADYPAMEKLSEQYRIQGAGDRPDSEKITISISSLRAVVEPAIAGIKLLLCCQIISSRVK